MRFRFFFLGKTWRKKSCNKKRAWKEGIAQTQTKQWKPKECGLSSLISCKTMETLSLFLAFFRLREKPHTCEKWGGRVEGSSSFVYHPLFFHKLTFFRSSSEPFIRRFAAILCWHKEPARAITTRFYSLDCFCPSSGESFVTAWQLPRGQVETGPWRREGYSLHLLLKI